MPVKQMPVPGLHLIGDLRDCAADLSVLTDLSALQQYCLDSVQKAGLTTVGQCFYQFGDGGGVTGVVVLAESHLSLHTWPEARYVTLDVYVCNYSGDNREKAEKLFASLQALFSPRNTQLKRVERG